MTSPDVPTRLARPLLIQPGSWQPVGIDVLEPAASAALRDPASTSVTAGPGAGKTELLAQKAAYLLQTGLCTAPQRILAISYKRDSASNLARRVAARAPDHAHRFVSITFDAFTKGLVDRFARGLPPAWSLRGRTYEITNWNARLVGDFIAALSPTSPLSYDLSAIPRDRFLPDALGTWALPLDLSAAPTDATEHVVRSWWDARYLSRDDPQVDFTMLNRLAELIVRANSRLRRALRVTYPFVFVDEFQDTTGAQYTFLGSVFGPPGVTTTAVGDSKQQIMKWAGSLEEAMARFQADFSATHHQLTWNFRSSVELVAVQHHFATRLEPGTATSVSKAPPQAIEEPVRIWNFAHDAGQAEHLADWIAQDIATSSRTASDFAFLARQRVAELEPALAAALARRGIKLRNDDARYGVLTLQDLLKNDVTQLVLGVLLLAAQRRRNAELWLDTHALLTRVRATGSEETAVRAVSDGLDSHLADLRRWLSANPVGTAGPVEVVQQAAAIAPPGDLAAFVRGKQTGDQLSLVLEALTSRMKAAMTGAGDWATALTDVAAQDAVTLMTIHRSKGLEYHTTVVLNVDDNQWWSYRKGNPEGMATFFVGLSRAAQRLIFTSTTGTANRGKVRELYELLGAAGVTEVTWQ